MQLSEATLLFATPADVTPESTASDEKQNIKKSDVQICDVWEQVYQLLQEHAAMLEHITGLDCSDEEPLHLVVKDCEQDELIRPTIRPQD